MELVKWQFGALTEDAVGDYIAAKMRELSAMGAAPAGGAGSAPPTDPGGPSDSSLPDWRCDKCGPSSVPEELSPWLRRSQAPTALVPGLSNAELSWAKAPLPPCADDIPTMTNIIREAHRFVKAAEGDR